MINKLHNLEKVMDSTFATGHSTWLRYVLRNSVSTLGDLKIAAKQVCSSNTAKDESTELQCSIAVSYCSTLQSISVYSFTYIRQPFLVGQIHERNK